MTIPHKKHAVAGWLLLAALNAAAPAFAADGPKLASEPPKLTSDGSKPVSDAPKLTAPVSQPAPVAAVVRAEAPFTPVLIYRDQVLTGDAVWRGEVLVEGALTIAPQATLTVEPGTVVRFRRTGTNAAILVVQGRLVAVGSKEAPIVFTSTFAAPAPSDWQGVMLLGTEKKNIVENCRIEGAVVAFEALFSNVTLKEVRAERSVIGMRFQDVLLTMDGGGSGSCDTGLSFLNSEANLRNITADGNRVGILADHSSVYLAAATLANNHGAAFSGHVSRIKFQGGSVVGNGNGITVMDCEGGIVGAKVVQNKEHGISLTGSRVRVSGNQVSGNGGNGIIVFDGSSVAWDNAIHDNGQYDLYNAGKEEFRAPGNWWGASGPRIFDNAGTAKVLYLPVLSTKPSQE
jgi:hypothetical protein